MFLYSAQAKRFLQICEMGDIQSFSKKHFQDRWTYEEGEWRSRVSHWPSEAHQHYSPHSRGPWAQVALTHYSNPYGLSFMDKGNYGLLLAHPHCGKEYSYGSGHVWETTKKWPENSMYFKKNKWKKWLHIFFLKKDKSTFPHYKW